jgi:2-polyprenyl-6-methoxyphenol hydroxylase-like FAD-dependent oxidoreductase
MMLGYLLARGGVDVYVLEKHADFLRDFRGDTIHPSTLELMHELGILDDFLKLPHQEVRELAVQVGRDTVTIADFTHLPTHCRFVGLMPQWDFLNFLAGKGQQYSGFHLKLRAEATDLLRENGRVVGVLANTPEGLLEIRADLTVGADGRHSVIRERAGLHVMNLGAPIDVMWMRFTRQPGDPEQTGGHAEPGRFFVMLNRGNYWQCAYVIPKGTAGQIQQKGIAPFREEIVGLCPFLAGRVEELRDWKDVSVLTVAVDRLSRWSLPGVLCIGDAAHAMSPIGGVGINLAIQDAVAAANILGASLLKGSPTEADLHRVQQRREFPTRATQRIQVFVQDRVVRRVLGSTKVLSLPWPLRLFRAWPFLRRIPARVVGIGFRPEHVKPLRARVAA